MHVLPSACVGLIPLRTSTGKSTAPDNTWTATALLFSTVMVGADGELSTGRNTPSRPLGMPSPLPSVSLSRDHITEAFKKSPDNGATLDLTHKSLTDVGEDGAEELANVGQGEDTGESAVVRYAGYYL